MPGLVPGIHVFLCSHQEDVDGRVKPGHDGSNSLAAPRDFLSDIGINGPNNRSAIREHADAVPTYSRR
jgi:hypothetical protein